MPNRARARNKVVTKAFDHHAEVCMPIHPCIVSSAGFSTGDRERYESVHLQRVALVKASAAIKLRMDGRRHAQKFFGQPKWRI